MLLTKSSTSYRLRMEHMKNIHLNRFLHFSILICLLGVSFLTQARWIETEGIAVIQRGNKVEARQQAIKNAMQEASYKIGLRFENQQRIIDGLVQHFSTTISHEGQAHRAEITSESARNGEYRVIMRFEFDEDQISQKCHPSTLKSSMTIVQASVENRADLRHGKIFKITHALPKKLNEVMINYATRYFPMPIKHTKITTEHSLLEKSYTQFSTWLSEVSNSQYLLVPTITDASTDPYLSFLGLFEFSPQRAFHLKADLYHGLSGELIWSKKYIHTGLWDFKRNESVDPHSEAFWRSKYGEVIEYILLNLTQDLDQALTCRPTLGQVVARKNDRVLVNIGYRHGIEPKDELSVILIREMFDRIAQVRILPEKSPAVVKVVTVTEYFSVAELEDKASSLNVQIDDLVVKSTDID